MRVQYPRNNAVCETDEQWAGRNMLRNAFMKSNGQSGEYQHTGYHSTPENTYLVIRADRPLYWEAKSLEMEGRQFFSLELAKRDARCMRAFLEANGVNVTGEQESVHSRKQHIPWTQPDLVRVYETGSHGPDTPYPATIAMLPGMKRTVWNLVRFEDDKYEF